MAADERLDSWKEIAAYLKRDVTTVRRWEKREGLPVQRHLHERRDSVYAYRAEIDRWWEGRGSHLAVSGTGPAAAADRRWRVPAPLAGWILAFGFFLTSALLSVLMLVRQPNDAASDSDSVRFAMEPPDDTSFGSVSLSPDGRMLAFTAVPARTETGKPRLWIRALDSLVARPLHDTEDASFPFWSRAGDALGFFAGGKLWLINVAGGSPHSIADAPNGRGGAWNRDGVILFAPHRDGAILRIAAAGGAATPVTTVARPSERGHVWPEFLPDGHRFVYLADSNQPEHHTVFASSLDQSTRHPVLKRASSNASYGANGYLFFAVDRQLKAQRFDARNLALTGERLSVADQVQQQIEFDHKMDFAVAGNGVLTYRTRQSPASRLVWRNRVEQLAALASEPAEYMEPALSPDETRVAVGIFDPEPSKRFGYGLATVRSDIWILDSSTGVRVQLTSNPAADWGPVWSPDGRTIVFSSNRRGALELFQKDVTNVTSGELPLVTKGLNPVAQSWSPDGNFILYSAFDEVTKGDLWLLPMSADRTPVPLVRTRSSEEQGQISPDGRWFTYASHESGRSEVYVQSFPRPGKRWRVSTNGGADARWRRDGKELFFVSNDRQLMAVPVRTEGIFEHGTPVALFDTGVPPFWYHARNLYDVSGDGRFLFMQAVEDDRSLPFTIVSSWRPGR